MKAAIEYRCNHAEKFKELEDIQFKEGVDKPKSSRLLSLKRQNEWSLLKHVMHTPQNNRQILCINLPFAGKRQFRRYEMPNLQEADLLIEMRDSQFKLQVKDRLRIYIFFEIQPAVCSPTIGDRSLEGDVELRDEENQFSRP